MELNVRYTGGVSFEAETRGHRIVCDQPQANGGQDSGMTPPELLLSSLGTCAGFYALSYLTARALPAAGLTVKVTAEKAAKPSRLDQMVIEVDVPGCSPEHEAGIQRAIKACLIHNTLLHSPHIETVVRMAAPAHDG
jgi:putative redox protein